MPLESQIKKKKKKATIEDDILKKMGFRSPVGFTPIEMKAIKKKIKKKMKQVGVK